MCPKIWSRLKNRLALVEFNKKTRTPLAIMQPTNLVLMPSKILPPSVHHVIIVPSLKTKSQAQKYLLDLIDYSDFIRGLYVKFRFGKGAFQNKHVENVYQMELMEIEKYVSEIETLMKKL